MEDAIQSPRTGNDPGFKYPHAPIAEALLDLQIQPIAEFDLERLSLFAEPEYSNREEMVEVTGNIEAGPLGVATKTSRRANGYRFTTTDGHHVALMRDNGFTFAELAPYDCWASFSEEGLRLWSRYAQLAQPAVVTRLGLRYINQIVMPPGDVKMGDYLLTRPELSDTMPLETAGFFMSMDLILREFDAICRITETIILNEQGNRALVFDIDVGRTGAFHPDDIAGIAAVFARLRNAKNLVFEASITDKARSLFY